MKKRPVQLLFSLTINIMFRLGTSEFESQQYQTVLLNFLADFCLSHSKILK